MDFKIPSEYENFVTSADDLLKEFSKQHEIFDKVSYCIYPDCGVFDQITEAIAIYQKLTSILNRLLNDCKYLWNQSSFNLKIVFPKVHDERIYFSGSVNVGNNIEDEWFIAYLLLKLSRLPISYLSGSHLKIVKIEFGFEMGKCA